MSLAAQQVVPQSPLQSNPDVTRSLLACLENAQHETWPFDYWLLQNALPVEDVDAISGLPFAPPEGADFDGRRETNNATRVYFTPENQKRFEVCRRIVRGFNDPRVRAAIAYTTGADLYDAHLRIEYCQDTEGFWLEPHTDILVKKFTMLVYLSDDPDLATAGTDIHEGPPDFTCVTSAPYAKNRGVIFIPGDNTWHGVGKRSLKGLRKSIIVNYVTSAWHNSWELS